MHDQSKFNAQSRFICKTIFWCCLLFAGMLSSAVYAQVNVASAVDYLKAQQAADGGISSDTDIATRFQSTAEALRAFEVLNEDDASVLTPAHAFIDNESYLNTENLSRKIFATISSVGDAATHVIALAARQNLDGGFGEFAGYDSTVIDTAFALEALALSNLANDQTLGNAVGFLLNQQLGSGAWSDGSNAASLYKTAIAMRALWHYRAVFSGVGYALDRAESYLYSQQDASGLWGATFESALILIALVPNAAEYSTVEGLVASLGDLQLANGSWENSPYTTALVLRALQSQATPIPPAATEGDIVGRVLDADTRLAIEGATISVGANSVSVNTDVAGQFAVSALTAGNYNVAISAAGYSNVSFSDVNVQAGRQNNLGDVVLTSSPTTGVLQGQVTSATTGNGLAGVAVSVSGAASASTISLADGRFSLVGLTPGDITITVVATGYLPVSASSTVAAGNSIVFNPVLVAATTDVNPLPGVTTQGQLRGQVLDADTGLPVPSVYIRLSGANRLGQFTASDGRYQFESLEPGDTVITMTKTGYHAVQVTGRILVGNASVFNVRLVPSSGDANAGGGDISTEPLPGVPSTGQIIGVVRNADNDSPLAGAEVIVSGSHNEATQTALDGSYSITDVTPGQIQIVVNNTGFVSASANGVVAAGNSVNFSPALLPEGSTVDLPASIIGTVIDASTGEGLRGVSILIDNSSADFTSSTNTTGRFETSVDPAGDYVVTFSKQGYVTQSLSVVLAGGTTLDFQTIKMKRSISEVAVYGVISDRETGEPLNNASVSIFGSSLTSQTNAAGRFRLNGVGIGTRTLIFTATGYGSQTLTYNFPAGGEYEINRGLGLSNSTGIKITAMMLGQSDYKAYENIDIQLSVLNESIVPAQGSVEFTLYNENNDAVRLFTATYLDSNGDTQTSYTFEAGRVTSVPLTWNTEYTPPGDYRLVSRVIAGNVFVGPSKVVLAERVTNITIKRTQAIELLSVTPLPAYSGVGATDFFELYAEVLNRSNVGYYFEANIRLRSPSNEVLAEEIVDFEISPDEDSLSIEWGEISAIFTEPGEHTLEVIRRAGPIPSGIQTGSISVAPGIRIDAVQSLDPPNVTPDGDKRIRLEVRLEGRELQ